MNRRWVLSVGLATVIIVAALPAAAHDHRLPEVVMRIDSKARRGDVVEFFWVRGARDGSGDCIGTWGDGFGWPQARRYRGSEAAIRMKKADRPMELFFSAGFGADGNGEPGGPMTPWPFVLRPAPLSAEPRAWGIVFPVPSEKHAFFELEASWSDEDGCGGFPDLGSQYGIWRFRLFRRGS